jgi:isopentenyl diphosphate isomerase/L-lactate dehydrogenase-like FMN-dependent dehydrogenase
MNAIVRQIHFPDRQFADSSLPVGEGLGVRSTEQAVEMMKLTKRQIEITMFAAGAGKLEDLKDGKLVMR